VEEQVEFGSQEADLQMLQELLNAPVVTASLGAEESAALAPANVISVTSEEMRRRGWRTLADVLANQPGFYVVDDLVTPSVSVRGISGGLRAGTRMLRIMINGVPVNFHPDLTAFIGPEYIPFEAIKRIEIAKGPLSAVYGANAFIATVNVITNGRSEGFAAEAAFRATAQPGFGFGGSGLINYGSENVDILLAFSTYQSNRSGLYLEKTFPEQDAALPRYRLFFDKESQKDLSLPASLMAQIHLRNATLGNFTLQGGIQQLDSMGEFQLNSALTHQSRHAIRNYWSNLRWERKWSSAVSSWASAGFSSGAPTRDEVLYLTGTNDFSYKRNFGYLGVDAAAGVDLWQGEAFALSIGADFSWERQQVLYYTQTFNAQQGRRKPGDSVDLVFDDDLKQLDLSNFGIYAQGVLTPSKKVPLRISGNLRLDLPNLFGPQISARLGAAYQWNPDFVTKIIAGRAFQTPSGVMLNGLPGFGFANNVIGARTQDQLNTLRPQTLHSIEAVAIARLFERLALEVSIFHQLLDDRIEFIQLSNNFVAQNAGQQQNQGFELSARVAAGRFTPFLTGAAQWSFVKGPNGAVMVDVFPPQQAPSIMGVVGLTVAVREAFFEATVQLRAVGARGATQSNVLLNNGMRYALRPYQSLDISAQTTELFLLGKSAQPTRLSVIARNILNDRHSEPGFGGFDTPTPGMTFLFELHQSF
jgi:iron complex outermembrane receptor protein